MKGEKMNNDYLNRLEFCREFDEQHKIINITYVKPHFIKITFSINELKEDIEKALNSFIEEYEKHFSIELDKTNTTPIAISHGDKYDSVEFNIYDKYMLELYTNKNK